MFVLAEMKHVIRIPPHIFKIKLNDAIAEELNKKLANKVQNSIFEVILYFISFLFAMSPFCYVWLCVCVCVYLNVEWQNQNCSNTTFVGGGGKHVKSARVRSVTCDKTVATPHLVGGGFMLYACIK